MPRAAVDIRGVLNDFLTAQLNRICLEDNDAPTVEAIRNKGGDHLSRKALVLGWLRARYHVLMGFTTQQGSLMAEGILQFADGRNLRERLQTRSDILTAFRDIHEVLSCIAPSNADGSKRNILSLTSKALWLCYPDDVPIYDSYALSAATVLSRLLGIAALAGTTEYAQYIDVWLQLFEKLMSGVDEQILPCQARRAFDRWLWHLGRAGLDTNIDPSASIQVECR